MASNEIPMIDFAPFLNGSDKISVAKALDSACRDVGFLVLTGHGVSSDIIQRTNKISQEFFALPDGDKMRLFLGEAAKGYIPPGGEALEQTLDKDSQPNPYEALAVGPRSDAEDRKLNDNLWPDVPADLRATWIEYYEAVESFINHLMQAFAIGLGLDEQFFQPFVDQHSSYLRATNYPELNTPLAPGQVRAGEHCDYGSLTVLWTQAPGLQVNYKNQWMDVPVREDGLIVNLGNLMAAWTNDRWCSTLHRVVPHYDTAGVAARKSSLVFFHIPNWDAEIACLPTCTSEGQPPKYAPVTTGDFVMNLIAKQYT